MDSRRFPAKAKLSLAVFILASAAWGIWLTPQCLEAYHLRQIVARTESLVADAASRDYSRPVVRGEPLPGNAWAHYRLALEEVRAEGKFSNVYVGILSAFIHGSPKADRSAVEAILTKHASILDHLRQGVRCQEARFAYDWSDGWCARTPHDGEQALRLLSVSAARVLRDAGRDMDAVELMIDFCVFSRDRDRNGIRPGRGSSSPMINEIQAILVGGGLSPEDVERLDRELEILDRATPNHSHGFPNAILAEGMGLRWEAGKGQVMRSFSCDNQKLTPGWRDLFSYRLMHARAFRLLDRWTTRLAPCEQMNLAAARREEDAVWAEMAEEEEVFRGSISVPIGCTWLRRDELSRLLILRIAAHYLRTGDILEFQDPFGSGLIQVRTGNPLRIWSFGRDGEDHSGRGAWRGFSGEDLVLEMSR